MHFRDHHPPFTALVRPLERRNGFALLFIQRVHLHGAVFDVDLTMWLLLPRESVLHPFLVVAVRIILSRVCATGFFTVCGSLCSLDGAGQEIAEFERLNEVAVPDHAAVFCADLVVHLVDFVDPAILCQHIFEESRNEMDPYFLTPSSSVSCILNTETSFCITLCIARRISAVLFGPSAVLVWSTTLMASAPASAEMPL